MYVRPIHPPKVVFLDTVLVDVCNDSDDLQRERIRANKAADGRLAWEKELRERLVDDDHALRLVLVGSGQLASLEQTGTRRGEVARSDMVIRDERILDRSSDKSGDLER